tara:strand:- start:4 stop:489 length:486 start_codon:yes stop_codon:yes gene_type:complete
MGALTFGSFPRSGNHFFTHLTNCKWIYHRICDLEKEANVVVSIRNPLECIPSWIVRENDCSKNRAELNLEWYCAYYEKCKELDIVVLPFEQLISDPLFCINYAHKKYGLEPLKSLDYDLSTGFHDSTKDKTGYEQIIDEMCLAPSFTRAMSLFEELCHPVG